MTTVRIIAVTTLLVLCVATLPSVAEAYTAELKVYYWPTNVQISGSSSANWSTTGFGGDARLYLRGPWGVHVNYATGSEGSWGGIFAGATSGNDNVYFGDVFYDLLSFPATVRVFAGYGRLQSNTTGPVIGTQTFTSSGLRVGSDVVLPLPATPLAFQAEVAWYPSNSTSYSLPGTTLTSSAAAWDYSASVQWTGPGGFLIEGGYRWINANTGSIGAPTVCPCTVNVNGVFISAGLRLL